MEYAAVMAIFNTFMHTGFTNTEQQKNDDKYLQQVMSLSLQIIIKYYHRKHHNNSNIHMLSLEILNKVFSHATVLSSS